MKILFSPFSPYVRKCLISGMVLGLNERIELLPSNAHPVQRDQAIIADNPLGKVPTFYTDDGLVLYDSRVICEYLNDLAQGSLFPHTAPQRWQVLTLQALGDGMLDACLLARYEDVARPEPVRWLDWRVAQLDKVHSALQALSQAGALAGPLNIGLISVACALWYLDLRFPEFNWRVQYPAVTSWYQQLAEKEPAVLAKWALA